MCKQYSSCQCLLCQIFELLVTSLLKVVLCNTIIVGLCVVNSVICHNGLTNGRQKHNILLHMVLRYEIIDKYPL
jgi:hypothetical protein